MSHGPLVASLCSHNEELTPRSRVLFDEAGDPVWHYVGIPIALGVGDRLVIWCANCGGWAGEHKLLKLVAISETSSEAFDLPVPSMLRARAEA